MAGFSNRNYQHQKKKKMKTSYTHFPIDLIIEILSRVPPKSLMRFKCVCRSWYNLISSPYFIFKQFKEYTDDRIHLLAYERVSERVNIFTGKTSVDLSWVYNPSHFFGIMKIKGPFNGIFCLFMQNQSIILWNPTTREVRKIRHCLPGSTEYISYNYSIGFGLDIVHDEYKLVLICRVQERRISKYLRVWSYNLKFNFWTQVEALQLPVDFLAEGQDGIYFNGVCYWIAYEDNNMQKAYFIAFDLLKENFEEVSRPPSDYKCDKLVLEVYNDSLVLIQSNYGHTCIYFELWTMKEKNWIKQLTIDSPYGSCDLLLQSKLFNKFVHNPNEKRFRDIGMLRCADAFYIYKESILSVKFDDYGFDIPWHILGVFEEDET